MPLGLILGAGVVCAKGSGVPSCNDSGNDDGHDKGAHGVTPIKGAAGSAAR